jgi:transcription initiation factor TFIIB
MQEFEKLKVLQTEQESFKSRTILKEQEKNAENQTETTCPECGGRHLIQDHEQAELVCQSCGLVIDNEFIDCGPGWRAFDADQGSKRAPTGAPMTLTIHDNGLSTMIDWRNLDSYSRAISSKNRAQFYRLRKSQRRIRISSTTERNLAFALSEMDRMASALGLPRNIRETAARVYRDALDKNLIRGRSIEGVSAAVIYAACRQCNLPRTLDEIAEVSRVSRKSIGWTYRFVSRELGLKLLPTSPLDYVPRFCSVLKLNGEVQTRAVEILRHAAKHELTNGRAPTGVAAASIYLASFMSAERRTQREVAEVSGVTEITIRNRYKELAEKLEIEIRL